MSGTIDIDMAFLRSKAVLTAAAAAEKAQHLVDRCIEERMAQGSDDLTPCEVLVRLANDCYAEHQAAFSRARAAWKQVMSGE
jgi:hypothetical protein